MTKPLGRMVAAWWLGLLLVCGMSQARAATVKDATNPPVESLGDNTYRLTRGSGFVAFRDTDGLAYRARQDAEKFCGDLGKQIRVVSLKEDKASLLKGGFSKATIVFQAVDAGEAGVANQTMRAAQPPRGVAWRENEAATDSAVEARSSELQALEDLHAKGILSDREFKKAKRRLDRLGD